MDKRICEHLVKDIPTHAVPIEFRMCADARKDQCPYLVPIEIDTDYVSFKQYFCGWEMRK